MSQTLRFAAFLVAVPVLAGCTLLLRCLFFAIASLGSLLGLKVVWPPVFVEERDAQLAETAEIFSDR